MKSAEEIAAEAYQIIGIIVRTADLDIHSRDVTRVLDYFDAVANGEDAGDILPWSLYLDGG